MVRLGTAFVALLVLLLDSNLGAQGNRDWLFARDKYSKAIGRTDKIVLSLGTSRLPTTGTFFSTVKEAGAILQATIAGRVTRTVNGQTELLEDSAQFPFGFKAPIGATANGIVSLPFRGSPIKGLQLKTTNTEYTNLAIEITMVRLDEPKLWAKIAQKLVGLAQSATLPASPLGSVAKYALDFANSSLSDALADAGKDQKFPLGSHTLNFNVAAPVMSGTYLLVLDSAQKDDGYVDPANPSSVCIFRETGVGDVIKVGRKIAGAKDIDGDGCSSSSYRTLTNPYVPIVLETEIPMPVERVHTKNGGGPNLPGLPESKIAHCRMANLDENDCSELVWSKR